jgi:hypothetical protein
VEMRKPLTTLVNAVPRWAPAYVTLAIPARSLAGTHWPRMALIAGYKVP